MNIYLIFTLNDETFSVLLVHLNVIFSSRKLELAGCVGLSLSRGHAHTTATADTNCPVLHGSSSKLNSNKTRSKRPLDAKFEL